MKDKQLAIAIRLELLDSLARIGIADIDVVASYQPTTQGDVLGNTIYFFKVSDVKEGWQGRAMTDKADPKHTEVQNVATTFQFMARARQVPTDDPDYLDSVTAADILSYASMALQSKATTSALANKNIGVRRVSEIRNPYFKNHSDQFEASPSFDFTVSHKTSIIYTNAVIEIIDGKTAPIGDRNVD